MRVLGERETSGTDGGGRPDTGGSGFFDLAPGDVEVHKTPGPPVAGRRPVDLKPALGVLGFLLIAGAVITGIILVWPTSAARVPNLVGRPLSVAMQSARRNGFKPTVTRWEHSEKIPDGAVISQLPGGNKVVKKGSGIALEVSKGPRPESGDESHGPAVTATAPTGQQGNSSEPISSRTVTIDPGHQALPAGQEWSDPGMSKRVLPNNEVRGVATGNAEYLVTLDTALKLKSLLEKDGIQVVMTGDRHHRPAGRHQGGHCGQRRIRPLCADTLRELPGPVPDRGGNTVSGQEQVD